MSDKTNGKIKDEIQEISYQIPSMKEGEYIDLIEVKTVNKILDEAKADFPSRDNEEYWDTYPSGDDYVYGLNPEKYLKAVEAWHLKWFGEVKKVEV